MLVFFVVGFQIIATTYFQSIGQVGTSIFLSLVRQVIFLLPLLMVLPRIFGLDGIWYTFPVSDLLATAVSLFLVIRSLRRM
jgi:Na+-driven multidrug efflux pump